MSPKASATPAVLSERYQLTEYDVQVYMYICNCIKLFSEK